MTGRGSFADGTIPLSVDGIQSVIRIARLKAAETLHSKLIQSQPDLDRLTLEMCQHERAAGVKLPDWLLEAELEAFRRQRSIHGRST